MIPLILLALVLAPTAPPQSHAARPVPAELSVVSYCDAQGQPTVLVTNDGAPLLIDWTSIATHPAFGSDPWSGSDWLGRGRFLGWMTSAPRLDVVVRYLDDGLPAQQSAGIECPAGGGTR